MLASVFERFVQQSPVSVMVRGLMERIFAPEALDELFETVAQQQYTRELLFSSVVNLMSLVVCAFYPSINAAYRAKAKELNVSRTSVYNKLNGIEPEVSAAIVRQSVEKLINVTHQMGKQFPPLVKGYRTRILDGTCLAATDHRLKALRPYAAKTMPGKCLVVLDPELQLAINVFPCEDGHSQERALFPQVLETVQAEELWLADRNMCTLGFLFGLHNRQAAFLIREHKTLPWQAMSELKEIGETETGQVWEQMIAISKDGQSLQLRRVIVKLFKPTRDGETEIVILTTLPLTVATAVRVADLYRKRWSVETLFQTVTTNFEGEIQTLGYPQAALFSFCLALVAYNILSVVRSALGSVHGSEEVKSGLSDFYLVNEVQRTYGGMMIAIEPTHWQVFATCSLFQLGQILQHLSAQVHLKSFLKQPRSPKKKKPPLIVDGKHRHLSTARLLKQDKISP
jgi:hypothetical protein